MERKPFNWSLLTKPILYSMLNSVQNKIVDKKLRVDELHAIMSKHIKQHLPIKIRLERDPTNDKGFVYVGGAYYSILDKEDKNRYIEIVFSYNSDQKWFKLSRHRWQRICGLFADTMLHEIIHTRQYRSRNFKAIPGYQSFAYYARDRRKQEYYGDRDEMGAFSFNIACELYEKFGDDFDSAAKFLDSNSYRRQTRSTFFKYMETFNHNHNHPIIKKIKKKIVSQLPYAQLGKPFRTNTYLTY